MTSFEIIAYEDHHQPEFKALNLEWLDLHHLTEQHDLDILNNPRKMILNQNGFIYLARLEGKIIGSAAIMKEHNGVYELAKMAVAKGHRGIGISHHLISTCIEKAKSLHAEKIILFSHHSLEPAIALYEKYGFQHVVLKDSPFDTADIKMELILKK